MKGKQILVVEDDPDISQLLQIHLQDAGAEAKVCNNGDWALSELKSNHWDLMILDIGLPGVDGLAVCQRAREAGNSLPILMLTAKSSELDRIQGLDIGADDYVSKPFSVSELIARVRAQLRRVALDREVEQASARIRCGGLFIDEARRHVEIHGQPVDLTAKEFDLLLYFASTPGQVYRRMQLLDGVWGSGYEGYEHTVNSHINRLRNKLNRIDKTTDYIVTVWGVGYKLNDALVLERVA